MQTKGFGDIHRAVSVYCLQGPPHTARPGGTQVMRDFEEGTLVNVAGRLVCVCVRVRGCGGLINL